MSISKINVAGTEHELIASGLTSTSAEKIKLENTNIAWGTCSTAAATAAKEITLVGNTGWQLKAGSIIAVKFSATNTASNPTLNVNGTGAKSVWYSAALITTGNLSCAGHANRPIIYMYDGTQYVFLGWAYDNNTTYTPPTLGSGYGTCSTAAATVAKTATLRGALAAVLKINHVPSKTAQTMSRMTRKKVMNDG